MIRSSKTSLKFANKGKLDSLKVFLKEYRNVVENFVNILWEAEKVNSLLPKETTDKVETWLSARMIQAAGKQASAIVRGTRKKDSQRRFVYAKLVKEGRMKEAARLEKIIRDNAASKPRIFDVEAELDSRFFEVDFSPSTTYFDGWLKLGSIGDKMKLILPLKKTKHLNKMFDGGILKGSVRLSNKAATFCFEKEVEPKEEGETIGLDIGKTTLFSTSDGQLSTTNRHGRDLNSILDKLSRKRKGSRAFLRTQGHRTNYINWSINQLDLGGIKTLRLEKIRNMRKGRRSSRMLSHWNYAEIFEKLEMKCEEFGVQVQRVSPTYTSQRCPACSWTQKANRKGKQFKCCKCFYEADADLNGARNISLDLVAISTKERRLRRNRKGFYFYEVGQEPIIPAVLENDVEIFQQKS